MDKAIVMVSFGSSDIKTVDKSIGKIETVVSEEFKGYKVCRAFTSKIIIKKLREKDNIIISSLGEILGELREMGIDEVIVQPLHIISGKEYEKIKDIIERYKLEFKTIKLGSPLFSVTEGKTLTKDFEKFLEYIKEVLNTDEKILFFGHGSSHEANLAYKELQEYLRNKGYKNIFVGTLEGELAIDNVIKDLKDNSVDSVTIYPLMISCGIHVERDMASEEKTSWKSKLEAEGIRVNLVKRGLGELESFNNIYIDKINYLVDEYKMDKQEY